MQTKDRKWALFFIVFLMVGSLNGCATTPNIGYKVEPIRQPAKNVSVKVNAFVDNRISRGQGVIGGVYNGYGMRLGDIFEPNGTVRALENAFKAELANSGYQLTEEARDIVIESFVESISCEISSTQNSTFAVHFKVTDKSQEVLNKVYQGKKSIWMTFDQTCSDALNSSMKELIKNFIKDLDEYVKT